VFVSESDHGIYDAMNKGISLSTGEIVGVLNADDFYTHSNVLEQVAEIFEDNLVSACYSDVEYVKRDDVNQVIRKWHSGHFSKDRFLFGWSPPHPTFFTRRRSFDKYGLYNISLKISADYEMMLRLLYVNEISVKYLPEVIIRMRDGGVSNKSWKNRVLANKEDRIAWQVNGVKPNMFTLGLKPLRKVVQFF
jgi:glycosyltransferase involved in cell wall biosynthesis